MKWFYVKIFGIVLLGAVIFWVLAIVMTKCFDLSVSSESAIITIIGILATFVVIGNFSQVYAMKQDLEKRIKDVELLVNRIMEYSRRVTDISNDNKNITTKSDDDEKHG